MQLCFQSSVRSSPCPVLGRSLYEPPPHKKEKSLRFLTRLLPTGLCTGTSLLKSREIRYHISSFFLDSVRLQVFMYKRTTPEKRERTHLQPDSTNKFCDVVQTLCERTSPWYSERINCENVSDHRFEGH